MALPDPITFTYNSVANNLNKLSTTGRVSDFRSADEVFSGRVSHETAKNGRSRHLISVEQRKYFADPLNTDRFINSTAKVHMVIDRPLIGYTVAEMLLLQQAFEGLLTDSLVTKLIQGEL